ncbi:hypothetical protein PNOK_0540600 [Pyrrhoderma noxium]|uniref:Uncharacterized protein n=1 Tax=Pyrrhoderma noxium TaxID=2282107 RepID=A0A286UGF1_9AGAM|nr:hypothetical protein PNOK_0540600 [Pyrrhoderma noxium]
MDDRGLNLHRLLHCIESLVLRINYVRTPHCDSPITAWNRFVDLPPNAISWRQIDSAPPLSPRELHGSGYPQTINKWTSAFIFFEL